MKSMMLTGLRKMEMREVPDPVIVSDTDVLISMERVGVCGSDVHYYTTGRIGSQIVEYPFPVGHECAGTVIKTGTAVNRLKPGDRIAIEPAMPCGECDQCLAGRPHTCRKLRFLGCPGQAGGSLSEYIVMPEKSCLLIPDHMSFDQAALAEPLSIGIYSVQLHGSPLAGKNIGILGCGPIGISVLLPAGVQGAGKIFVTDKLSERLELASNMGASWTGNPDKEDIISVIAEMEPLMLDAVFECCGQQDAIDQAIELLKPGGKIILIGIPEFDHWTLNADMIRRKEICLQNVRRQNRSYQTALDMIAQGNINAEKMITHRFSFGQTKEAFDLVAEYKDGVMKAMIEF